MKGGGFYKVMKNNLASKLADKKLIIIFGALLIALGFVVYGYLNTPESLIGVNQPVNIDSAKASEQVYLKNGDSYNLKAGFISEDLNGVKQPMLAYGGSIPGPTFHVTEGDKINFNFKNDINMDTTIHAHGLRQDFKMDGMPEMSQDPIKPGGSFKYQWSFPDPGIYWYHPHIREDYQQGSGMYGAIIVEPKDKSYWPSSDQSNTLILSDALTNPETGLLVPFNKNKADHKLMGRYGNTLLINGKTNWQTELKANTVQRFFVANASSARPYRFAFEGLKMKVVGSDNGRVGKEYFADTLTISPGERYIVDVVFDKSGTVAIKNDAPGAVSTLGTVKISENSSQSESASGYTNLRTNQDVIDKITNLPSQVTVDKHLVLKLKPANMSGGMGSESMMGGGSSTHMMPDGTTMDSSGNTISPETAGIEWSDMGMGAMDAEWKITDQDTNKSGNDIKWDFKKGEVVRITIKNDSNSMHSMQHPIHLHGQRFVVVSKNGQANTNIEWKDTITIPSGQTYELIAVMDNPGEWMLHCHIAEHLESGMAISFKVSE